MQQNLDNNNCIQEDEIDLRELFATIGRYKKSIFLITMLITIVAIAVVYRLPKYYKTTTTIEVKPKDGSKGFSLGSGAGALLSLAGVGGGATNIDKEAAQLTMFNTNNLVLNKVPLTAQYWQKDFFRYLPLNENNSSVVVKMFESNNPKKFKMNVVIKPIGSGKYELYGDKLIGTYTFNKVAHNQDFKLLVEKRDKGYLPDKITLYGNRHYIYDAIIKKNLKAEADKKNPFINISYLDTVPSRGEKYVKELIKQYTNLSIKRELEDLNITLQSLNKQISDIEQKVSLSQKKMEKFKQKQKIIAPEAQVEVLLKEKAFVSKELMINQYKLNLIKQIFQQIKKGKSLTSIAPSLMEFQDKVTIQLIGKLQELELEKTNLSQEFTKQSPELKTIKKQIASIKNSIRANLKNIYSTLQSQNRELSLTLKKYESKIEEAPKTEAQMTNILRDYKFNEKLYAYLLQKRAATILKMQEAKSKFRVIEPIYTDYKPAKPKKALIVIVAFITALILSIFIAFFREFLKNENVDTQKA